MKRSRFDTRLIKLRGMGHPVNVVSNNYGAFYTVDVTDREGNTYYYKMFRSNIDEKDMAEIIDNVSRVAAFVRDKERREARRRDLPKR